MAAGYRPQSADESLLRRLAVRPILPQEEPRWVELMRTHHYLGLKWLAGEQIKYVAEEQEGGAWVALLSFSASSLKCAARDSWIGWSKEHKYRRLRYTCCNSRFLILPTYNLGNLASKVLALSCKRIASDWLERWGHRLVLLEIYVDESRFAGSSYKAAGFVAVGQTKGYGRRNRPHQESYFRHGAKKRVYVKELDQRARKLLSGEVMPAHLEGGDGSLLSKVPLGGLLDRLSVIPDPRDRHGMRHEQASILAVAALGVICGLKSLRAIGEWAVDLNQEQRCELGLRRSQRSRKYRVPSEPTIRRTLHRVDVGALDKALYGFIEERCPFVQLAVDGKTLKGSKDGEQKAVHLLAALVPGKGVVLSQEQVDGKSNEIKAIRPLLDRLDLCGKVVSADAMHT